MLLCVVCLGAWEDNNGGDSTYTTFPDSVSHFRQAWQKPGILFIAFLMILHFRIHFQSSLSCRLVMTSKAINIISVIANIIITAGLIIYINLKLTR